MIIIEWKEEGHNMNRKKGMNKKAIDGDLDDWNVETTSCFPMVIGRRHN